MRGRYAVLPDGQHVYVVPSKMVAAGLRLLDVAREVGPYKERQLLVLTGGRVESLPMERREMVPTGEYTATSSAIAIGARATITDADYETLDEGAREMYVRVREARVSEEALDVSDFARVELDDRTMPEAPRNWEPGIQGVIVGPPFDTAFPGWLTGFRAQALAIAAEYATDTIYDRSGDPRTFEVPIRAYYDPPQTTRVKVMRKMVTRETWLTNQVKVTDVHDMIGGTSLIDAQRRWAEEEQRIRSLLEPWTQIRVCSHCNGAGVLTKGTK